MRLDSGFRFVEALLVSVCLVVASGVEGACLKPLTSEQLRQRAAGLTAIGVGTVTAWGVVNWDYFSKQPTSSSEGWFGQDTPEGGADKLGHVFSTYVTAQGLAGLFDRWCVTREDAALYGALSSFAILGYMELGDAFSDYGFSHEDLVANAVGGIAGYYRHRYPALARKIDLRWEVGIEPNQADITTDYDNSKYLLALKLNGFSHFRHSWIRHLEVHAGYYARGYGDPGTPDERTVYFGIGVNLTDLLRRKNYHKTATFLNYYQPPGLYVPAERTLAD